MQLTKPHAIALKDRCVALEGLCALTYVRTPDANSFIIEGRYNKLILELIYLELKHVYCYMGVGNVV
jgi:hypothetical protein